MLIVRSGMVRVEGPDVRVWRPVGLAVVVSWSVLGVLAWLWHRPHVLMAIPLLTALWLAVRPRLRVWVCFTRTETWVERRFGCLGYGQRRLEDDTRVFATRTFRDDEWADFGFVVNHRLVVGRTAEAVDAVLIVDDSIGSTAPSDGAFAAAANEAISALRLP